MDGPKINMSLIGKIKSTDAFIVGSLNIADALKKNILSKGLLYLFYKFVGGIYFYLKYSQTPVFQHILIQTNYKCTRKCDFCYYGIKKAKEMNDEMETQLFYSIIDQLEKIKYSGRISLFEINEPLTDKRIFAFLNYASTKLSRAWFYLCSNGDLIDNDVIMRLFANGLDQLDICSYDEAAKKKIDRLLGEIDRRKYHIRHILRLNEKFISSNRGGNIKKYFGKNKENYLFCDRVFKILYIKPNGDVPACFDDLFSENIMGSVKDQAILEIWYGHKYEALRAGLKHGDRSLSEVCRRCNYVGLYGHYKIPKSLHHKKIQKISN